MSSQAGKGSVDPIRKSLIIVALVAGMLLLYRFAIPSGEIDPTGMLALGFVILAGYTLGELVGVIQLPHITGYLIGGLLMGGSVAAALPEAWQVGPFEEGILNHDVLDQLSLFNTLALALIALTAGGELKIANLRRDLRAITGVLGGQALTISAGAFVLMWCIGGGIAPITLPTFVGQTTAQILSFGALLAAVSLATSPAATIAVINGANARGPMTQTVLSTVVLKDVVVVVAFSVAGAVAGQFLGGTAIEGGLGMYLLIHVGGSIVVGATVGAGLALYLRFVGAEVLLLLVGLIYTASFVAGTLHLDPLLLFLAAGFVTSNFSREGDTLIHNVERLSMPVYVVFFTLAGAGLHLDSLAQMAPYALALVAVRAGTMWVGVGLGAAAAGADDGTRRYGWLGFVSQAGVALSLASLIGDTYGAPGEELETLIIASLAINELIGPVLLKVGLGLAGEVAADEVEEEPPEPVPTELPGEEQVVAWEPPEGVPDPWGPAAETASDRLNVLAADLEADLHGLVRDLLQGPLSEANESASVYLRALRREFLRHHRRAQVRLQAEDSRADAPAVLRSEQADIAERWRALVLDRSARLTHAAWSPTLLVEAVDRIVEDLPDLVEAPLEDASLESRPDESPLMAIRRGLLRTRVRWRRLLGSSPPQRIVRIRDLARYHLSGRLPPDLEPVAALLVNAQAHLANRTRGIFDRVVASYDEVARSAETEEGLTDQALVEAVSDVRTAIDEEFALASRELDHITQDGAIRAGIALGAALQQFKAELPLFGTLDQSNVSRRYSKVFGLRTAGLELLGRRVDEARQGNAAQYSALALELELVGLEGRIKQAIARHGSQLARMVKGKGPTQLDRVQAALTEALAQLEAHISSNQPGDAMAGAIRASAEPLAKVVGEATRAARQLNEYLADEEGVAPLLDALLRAAGTLTDRYQVPAGRMAVGERTLPVDPGTADVPTRELTIAYIETSVSRNLVSLSRDLAASAEGLGKALEELERVVAFNVELAGAELDVLEGEAVPDQTRAIVHEMLLGALGRSQRRLADLQETARAWPELAREGVRTAILGDLEVFRGQLVDGRVTELRLRLLRERATSGRLASASELSGGLAQILTRFEAFLTTAVGIDRLDALRQTLGLPLSEAGTDPTPATFAAPGRPDQLPVVYRRLFSDQALEAGDLLTGRQDEISRARRALDAAQGGLPAVAIVGMDGAGKGAVVNAVVRASSGHRIVRLEPGAPVSLAEVERWMADLVGGELVVIEGVKWLFTMAPDGFAPLRRLVDGVIGHPDTRWLVAASTTVWDYASRAAPLDDAFPEVIHLRPLDSDELQAAVLARHSMSGYELRFEAQEDLGWQVQHLLTRRADQGERQREAWFNTLHSATDGVIHDALSYWMASIRKVDPAEGVVRVGPVPRPPMNALSRLSDEVLLTLSQVMRQGWITADIHADLFRRSRSYSAAHLARMTHYGMLVADDGRFRIAPHLITAVHRVLSHRGWLV